MMLILFKWKPAWSNQIVTSSQEPWDSSHYGDISIKGQDFFNWYFTWTLITFEEQKKFGGQGEIKDKRTFWLFGI